jgi:hypothetical protein
MALLDCDELFLRYFDPWYSDQDRSRRVYRATRPDIERLNVPPDLAASDISVLTQESQDETAARVRDMLEAATADWPVLFKVKGLPSSDWIAEFDRHFQRRRIQKIIKRSAPEQYDNDYLVLCCELGAVLGDVLVSLEPRLMWLYDWPYWDSALYDQSTRSRLNVFHWAIKKMSEYGVDDGLTAKIDAGRKTLWTAE